MFTTPKKLIFVKRGARGANFFLRDLERAVAAATAAAAPQPCSGRGRSRGQKPKSNGTSVWIAPLEMDSPGAWRRRRRRLQRPFKRPL